MYRVVNHDLNGEVWGEASSIDEAKKIQEENYFFMTGVQRLSGGKWTDVDGLHEELSDYIKEALR
ncbi:hypothetical protein [Paenibacillus illinoisensis]|uniref:Uncharacterized protein n=1 Tax=Paenibacillus illinoisensis TaxID=59845 RepID=A0A2W0C8H4_9BACL|nr:hypothetical protein [Paenibacillus illinoisensis]PYY28304.1 hypothetical protein PIL02S_03455 [Paenibacillus illinoisensis]